MTEWINIKDRLPEKEGLYIVSGKEQVWQAQFLHIGPARGWVNSATNPPVEYWLPLPEPPKEADNGMD